MHAQTQNTEATHRVINTTHRSSKELRRHRITLGRVVDKKSGKVIIPGEKVIGNLSQPHALHGHLKKVVIVKIPAEGGFFLKKMKLKTALQKGYYKVNTTDTKTKAAIEKSLEPFKSKANA